jgi:Na+-driven multidrug efflux pump
MIPFFIGMWLFLTYMEFFNPENSEKMGVMGYIFMTVLFLGLTVMMWLMTSGRLPAYIIEETKEEEK